jgi:predicted amidohydrolase YtcJ
MFLTTNAVALLLLSGPTTAVATEPPDRVLVNAIVHTMDDARPRAEAVAITGGRITGVGSSRDLLATKGPGTEVLDLNGATVIPGLKESHGHFVGIGEARMSLNLVGTKSWDEVVARWRRR